MTDTTVTITTRRKGRKGIRVMRVTDLQGGVIAMFTERTDRSGAGKGEWYVGSGQGHIGNRRNRFNFYCPMPIKHAARMAADRQLEGAIQPWLP